MTYIVRFEKKVYVGPSVIDSFHDNFMPRSKGWGGGRRARPHLENHKPVGFPSNTGLDPLENHKAAKAAINVGPLWVRQQNAL